MYFNIFPAIGMQNRDEASPSIILAVQAILTYFPLSVSKNADNS